MLTENEVTEANRNDRWIKLNQACRLSAQCQYKRHSWGVSMNPRGAWLLYRINRHISILVHLRFIDGCHVV